MALFKNFVITVCVCSVVRGLLSIILPRNKNLDIVYVSINIIFSFAITMQIVEIFKNIF